MTGHMITTSIDEGVEADILSEKDGETGDNQSTGSRPNVCTDKCGLAPSSLYGDMSQYVPNSNSNTSLTSGMASPFTSFDSTLESDMMSSVSSGQGVFAPCSYSAYPCNNNNCAGQPSVTSVAPPAKTSANANINNPAQSPLEELSQDRTQTRSPVNFREGRRASDGLVTQGVIAFRQRLRESMRATGMIELRQEHQHLQNLYRTNLTPEEIVQLQRQHHQYHERANVRQWSLDDKYMQPERPRPLMKRMSLPSETFDIQPHRLLALKQSLQVEEKMDRGVPPGGQEEVHPPTMPYPPQSKPLQQSLLQHRLQQKRQLFQKQSQLHSQLQQLHIDPQAYSPAPLQQPQEAKAPSHQQPSPSSQPIPSCMGSPAMHPPVSRQASYKLAQQQTVMPPEESRSITPWQMAHIELLQQGDLQKPLVPHVAPQLHNRDLSTGLQHQLPHQYPGWQPPQPCSLQMPEIHEKPSQELLQKYLTVEERLLPGTEPCLEEGSGRESSPTGNGGVDDSAQLSERLSSALSAVSCASSNRPKTADSSPSPVDVVDESMELA